ncbi:2365_t:CDS:2, partial [Racocetra fulgida]
GKKVHMPHDDFQSLSFIPDPKPLENENEEIQLQATLDGLYYTCGSQLLPEDHELSKHLSVRLNITCNSPIEETYFS